MSHHVLALCTAHTDTHTHRTAYAQATNIRMADPAPGPSQGQRTPADADFPPWRRERLIQALAAHLGQASINKEIKLEQNEVQETLEQNQNKVDKAPDKETLLNVQDKAEANGPDAKDVPLPQFASSTADRKWREFKRKKNQREALRKKRKALSKEDL